MDMLTGTEKTAIQKIDAKAGNQKIVKDVEVMTFLSRALLADNVSILIAK